MNKVASFIPFVLRRHAFISGTGRCLLIGVCLITLAQGVLAQTAETQDIPAQPAPAQGPGQNIASDKPIPPGGVRITTRAPDPGKWDLVPATPTSPRVFNCKPLACAAATRVMITTLRSPTRNPDPKALEKFAKVDLPKAIRAQSAAQDVLSDGANKMETLNSAALRLKDHPAVTNETRYTAGKKIVFIDTAMIFVGPVMLTFSAISPNRDLAQKSLAEFVAAVDIKEGPPLPVTSGSQPVPLTPSRPEPPKPTVSPDIPQSL